MTVVEIGSGTGHNLAAIVKRVGEDGKVLAVDCAQPMLARCAERIRKNNWNNVQLIDREYGFARFQQAPQMRCSCPIRSP